MGHRLIVKGRKSKTKTVTGKNKTQTVAGSLLLQRERQDFKPSPLACTNRHKKKEPEQGRCWWWPRSRVTAPAPLSAQEAQGPLHCSQRGFKHWTRSTPHQEPPPHTHTPPPSPPVKAGIETVSLPRRLHSASGSFSIPCPREPPTLHPLACEPNRCSHFCSRRFFLKKRSTVI